MNWLRNFMNGRYGRLDSLNIAVFVVYLALAFIRVILSLVFRFGGFLTPLGTITSLPSMSVIVIAVSFCCPLLVQPTSKKAISKERHDFPKVLFITKLTLKVYSLSFTL